METIFEKQRRLHEEIESLERAAVEQMLKNTDESTTKTVRIAADSLTTA